MHLRPYRVLIWTGVCLLAAELLLEARAASRGWDALLLGLEPGWNTSRDERFGPAEGFPFRSEIVAPEPRGDTLRLWFASSSYGEDTHFTPPEVFPNQVGSLLARSGRPAQTLNASRAGYHVRRNTAQLRELGSRWRPDVVVLYQMSNDIDHLSENLARIAAAAGGGGAPGQAEPAGDGLSTVARLTERLTLYKHLKMQVTTRLAEGRPLQDQLDPVAEDVFERWVREFIAAAREVGARPVLCTFPVSHTVGTLADLPPSYRQQTLAMNVELSMLGWLQAVAAFNERLRAIARDEDALLVDVAAEIGGRSELFRDLWHLTAEGHTQVAGVIAAALEE